MNPHPCRSRIVSASRHAILCAVPLLIGFTPGWAQTDIQRETATSTRARTAPKVEPPERGEEGATSSGVDDSDIYGLQLLLAEDVVDHPFLFSASYGFFQTDNVGLTPANEQDDIYSVGSLSLKWFPALNAHTRLNASVGYGRYRYDDFDLLDFDLVDGAVGVLYYPAATGTPLDWVVKDAQVFLQYRGYVILEPDLGDSSFDNQSLNVGFLRTVPVSRTHLAFYGLDADLSLAASDDDSRRHEFSANAGYQIQWNRWLTTSANYRLAWYEYTENGRGDWNHVLPLGARAEFCEWAYVFASVGFTHNDSNRDAFDYDRWDVGAQLGVQVLFGGESPFRAAFRSAN